MRIRNIALLALLTVCTACASTARSPMPRSVAGTVAHGEVVTVPSGTVADWNILVAPMQMGAEEPRSEDDNRLLAFRVFATVLNDTSWQITAQYKFAYALNNADVYWVQGSANYLVVRR
ncbi:MAG TPA: hypothetical protein VHG28_10505 [Longimicrobiaceae bacterium]|nr:hypothetical protein [Longimicrobiaceae bacterium]